ncbi:subunit of TIM23 translocase complex [Imshaugia aleurites]|uniref:Subunit of TIM23 translocase complex n=1 Tax=Imshaugia aleurites TaxID=172621 RepID=A0A8H3G296_9LECA|nr:subunit of TIM23 translocase complex [Imshaugia aleurites]
MPPMPSSATGGGRMQGPSTFDKWKRGAMLGGSVGLIMGFIFGGFNIMRYGAGPSGPMRTLGQYMLGSGATFGFFMSIGTVIRTEGNSPSATEAFARARRQSTILSRNEYDGTICELQLVRRTLDATSGDMIQKRREEGGGVADKQVRTRLK